MVMMRSVLFILAALSFESCYAQQEIILIGTMHNGPPGGEKDLVPVRMALEKFKPQVICVEYPLGNDTVSIAWRYGARHYSNQTVLMQQWQLESERIKDNIETLLNDPALAQNVKQLINLFSLYYASSDFSNSDYQSFRIMEEIKKDSSNLNLIKSHPAFEYLTSLYHKRFVYKEYPTLIFPLASKLKLTHLYPIDDLRSMSQPHNDLDSISDEQKKAYQQSTDTYVKRLKALPKEANQLLFLNSEEIIGFSYDALKILPTWVARNKQMARYIHDVAKSDPGKRVAVFFGAGHIGQIRKELQELNSSYRVLTLTDIMK